MNNERFIIANEILFSKLSHLNYKQNINNYKVTS